MLQLYTYMALRGHLYGMATTYFQSWAFKADGIGNVWISETILYDAIFSEGRVSVVEVNLQSQAVSLACLVMCGPKV